MLAAVLITAFAGVGYAHTLTAADGKATVYTTCVQETHCALTFDDGPYIFNSDITKILNDTGVTATFFVRDCIYDDAPQETLKKLYKEGHQIGSHTWSHPDLATLNQSQIAAELDKLDLALKRIVGVIPACLRPPYGSYNDDVLTVAGARNKCVVTWNMDSGDSAGKNATEIKAAYEAGKKTPNGTMIALNHETYNETVKALPDIIAILKDWGYQFVNMSTCLGGIPAYTSITDPGKADATWHC
ncbi:carbohydrate esterase family 4 protein [Mycena rebaudengoi]|nr:carbohydrate esterase family 4 protein [Mycena rebaudengoi]